MNERIQQLADEAVTRVALRCEGSMEDVACGDKHGEWIRYNDLGKFAELIVKETMQVVANNLPQNTYLDVADAVIEHFGVEP